MVGIVILFCLWLQYEIRRTKRIENSRKDIFWETEHKANLTRRADISNLDYIAVPLLTLPMEDHRDFAINSCRDKILSLSHQKILNLTGITNTELKLKYGAQNMKVLSEFDNNYILLVRTLNQWGELYFSLGQFSQAACILEFAVSSHTDVGNTYRLLASVYLAMGNADKINELIATLASTTVLNKEALTADLLRTKNS